MKMRVTSIKDKIEGQRRIKYIKGDITTNTTEIKRINRNYYKKLYVNIGKSRRNGKIPGHMCPTKIESGKHRNLNRPTIKTKIKSVILSQQT